MIHWIARLFGYRNEQFESLTEYYDNGVRVRIWRSERSLEAAAAPDTRDLEDAWANTPQTDIVILARAIGSKPRVSCVAIVDRDGNGISYYPDWH